MIWKDNLGECEWSPLIFQEQPPKNLNMEFINEQFLLTRDNIRVREKVANLTDIL